ncbi:MAG: DUF2127 domain-containing protein [Proteobacteria bacterium]|uniref:DUF2127 domain-containing protein n=1 Tax=Rudaea sp. TaxID=2136325 RepID=UPI00321FC946|nr:DUF2127 domain-containing protein [Pseudomonadota bacterium]
MASHDKVALRTIAVFKVAKAFGLLVVAVAAFGLVHTPWLDRLAQWLLSLPLQNGHAVIVRWVEQLLDLSPRRFELIGAVAIVYGSVFATEGWGLWTGRRWAEYLTVFATASLIPLEAWEIFHHFTWLKVLALAINVAIVIYLWRIVRRD